MINSYVCIDLETTGLNPKTDKIIEIGAVKVSDGKISDRFSCFVNPHTPIPFEIERLTGMEISEIFRQYGEPHFRELEAKYIREMPGNSVVATGGGAIINPVTAETARNAGTVVFLDADFELCYNRIKGDTHRPLVMKNTKEQLNELFNKRREIYLKNSDFSVNSNLSETEILDMILKGIK